MSLLISSRTCLVLSFISSNSNKPLRLNKLANLNCKTPITTGAQTIWLRHNSTSNTTTTTNGLDPQEPKLIYRGQLTRRIIFLKSFSMFSSIGLAMSYYYVMKVKGLSGSMIGLGFAFSPFFLSPFIISWLFKRYITRIYYNPSDETYTAHHYGLLLNQKSCTYTRDQVEISPVTNMMNTFTVGKKPFFLHEPDLVDVESIKLYKKMVGYDKIDQSKPNSE